MTNLYEQATRQCVCRSLSGRAYLDVKGEEARKFLNGILTADIQKLPDGGGAYALLLTPKGKILSDLFCYCCGESLFGIDVAAERKGLVAETLRRYLVFQKAEIVDQSEKWGGVALLGPGSASTLERLGLSLPAREWRYGGGSLEGVNLYVIRKNKWGLPCYELWCRKGEEGRLRKILNLPFLDEVTAEILRIESATPRFGVDMDDTTIPQEANLYGALSFTKGCYVGQETVARLEHRGHVGKKLVLLKLEGKEVPPPGEKITTEKGEAAGTVTSACFSPKHNAALALGTLRYAFLNAEFKGFRRLFSEAPPSRR